MCIRYRNGLNSSFLKRSLVFVCTGKKTNLLVDKCPSSSTLRMRVAVRYNSLPMYLEMVGLQLAQRTRLVVGSFISKAR